jgi:molybdopterin molybdotransferase
LIARIGGARPADAERWISASLAAPLPSNGPREFYQPAILDERGAVTPLPWKGSADIYTLAAANALLVRGENEPAQPAGAVVRVLEIPS